MKKPNGRLLRLCAIGCIQGLRVDYRQTGTDTAATYVKIQGERASIEGLWDTYKNYLNVGVTPCTVAQIRSECINEVEAWHEYSRVNKLELAEYKRLKLKLERMEKEK